MSSMMQMPNLCAKCGENPPTQAHTIQEQRISLSPWTFLTMFIGVGVTNRQIITYRVPICDDCMAKIRAREHFWTRFIRVGMSLFVIGILLVLSQTNALNSIPVFASLGERFNAHPRDLTAIGLMILGFGMMLVTSYMNKTRMASTNGKTFRFYNKRFQKEFAEANPDMVKHPFWKAKRSPD
jgi:hypothetical protein